MASLLAIGAHRLIGRTDIAEATLLRNAHPDLGLN
jgi:hypothetical protein